MTAIEAHDNSERDELISLAQRIRDWQETRKLTTSALLRQYPDLGSDKTYGLICRGELDELDTETWLTRYRAAWAVMESFAERASRSDEIYDDLAGVAQLRKALMDILQEAGITRVLLVEGYSGSGKSTTALALQRRYGSKIVIVEACDATGASPMAFLGTILAALGVTEMPMVTATRLQMVQKKLRERRLTLIVDEAHHLRPVNLNVLKTLVNTTPGEFVLLALPTLWNRLEHQAYEEVRQLTGNRLSERIRLHDVDRDSDVRKLLERLGGITDPALVKAVASAAKGRGNLQFVVQVTKRLREQSIKGAPTAEQVHAAIRSQLARRDEG